MKPIEKTPAETKQFNIKKTIVDFIFLIAGCFFGAFGSVGIMVPNGLSSGGLGGISRILQAIFPGLDYSVTFAALTILTLVVVGIVLGREEFRKLALLAVLYPAVTMVAEHIDFHLLQEKDLFLAAVYHGVASGLCSGLILSRGYSLCASDAIAKMLRKKIFKTASVSKILLAIDGAVIIASGFFYGINIALYALITQVVLTKIIDVVLFGFASHIVEVKIIMQDYAPVQEYILHTLGRGISISHIVGAYTMQPHDQLLTYCSPRESVLIRQLVAEHDPHAFVTVMKVDTVWGQGAGFSNLLNADREQ